MTSTVSQARLARLCLITAVLLGLAGMLLGLAMGALEDFRLKGVHVHVNLIGFVTLFLAGLFYRAVPAAAGALGWMHYGLTVAGLGLMTPGLAGIFLGIPSIAWMVKPGSVLAIAGMMLFVWVVMRGTRPGAEGFGGGHGHARLPLSVVDDHHAAAATRVSRLTAERIIADAARAAARTSAA